VLAGLAGVGFPKSDGEVGAGDFGADLLKSKGLLLFAFEPPPKLIEGSAGVVADEVLPKAKGVLDVWPGVVVGGKL
jgi:hypothetical protein